MWRLFFFVGVKDVRASFGVLFLRIFIGLQLLIGHGLPKFQMRDSLKSDWFVPYFLPISSDWSFWGTLFAEIVCAGFLILGLWTRFSLIILLFTFYVATFEVHAGDSWFLGPGIRVAKEPALLYLSSLFTLFILGSGKFSFDSHLSR